MKESDTNASRRAGFICSTSVHASALSAFAVYQHLTGSCNGMTKFPLFTLQRSHTSSIFPIHLTTDSPVVEFWDKFDVESFVFHLIAKIACSKLSQIPRTMSPNSYKSILPPHRFPLPSYSLTLYAFEGRYIKL